MNAPCGSEEIGKPVERWTRHDAAQHLFFFLFHMLSIISFCIKTGRCISHLFSHLLTCHNLHLHLHCTYVSMQLSYLAMSSCYQITPVSAQLLMCFLALFGKKTLRLTLRSTRPIAKSPV